jgi:hypothetical protein
VEGSAEFPDIIESTGIPERSAWRYINRFVEQGILETVRGSQTIVSFKRKLIFEDMKKHLAALSRYLNLGYKCRWGWIFKDSEKVRPYRERKRNLSPACQSDNGVIVCESDKQANSVLKDLKELGIKRKVAFLLRAFPSIPGPRGACTE